MNVCEVHRAINVMFDHQEFRDTLPELCSLELWLNALRKRKYKKKLRLAQHDLNAVIRFCPFGYNTLHKQY